MENGASNCIIDNWFAEDFESDKEKEQFNRMLEMLEDDDDVQKVYHNAEISDSILEKLV